MNILIKILYLLSAGPGDINFFILKSLNNLYISNIIFYDSLINLDLLNFCKKFSIKILIGKRFLQKSIYKKTIYKQITILYKKYKIISKIKSGDINFFSRIYNEIKFLELNYINYIINPGITSTLSYFSKFKLPISLRFNISNILFITYFNNINILKISKSFIDKTIIYYMINNNIYYILKFLIKKIICNQYISIIESVTLIDEHIFIFNIYDFSLNIFNNFLLLNLPKFLILTNLFNYLKIKNIFIFLF